MAIFPGSAIPSGVTTYTIDQSLRFNLGDSASLSRTPGSDGNRKTWTFSFWYKCVDPSFPGDRDILSDSQAGSPTDEHWFRFGIRGTNNQLLLFPGYNYNIYATDAFFRDVGAWYHIVLRVDTTQASFDDRLRIYVNNELKAITNVSSGPSGEPPQDWVTGINSTDKQELMVYSYGTDVFVPGYLAEVYMIDGLSLAPSSFGETDEDTNQWKPIDASGLTFGTNGFYQKYGSDGGYTSFTTPGANTWTCPAGVTEVQLLVVAGGGGGGGGVNAGGGAGGGGLLEDASYTVVPGTVYDITVGAGGAGTPAGFTNGVNGSDSVWNVNAEGSGATQTAVGGGGGGTAQPTDNGVGSDGGSGGGGAFYGAAGAGGSATQGDSGGGTGYGFGGGSGFTSGANDQGGGGGGAGAVGTNSASSIPGVGGAGRANTITGASVTYAGGGGGGSRTTTGGAGGSGGGGAGGASTGTNGTAGTANTGGAGGGGGNGSTKGGDGGSGIVIVKPAAGYGFGLDSSGNGNNFTETNLVASDKMVDSPTNNFATWNPLAYDGGTAMTEGNLNAYGSSGTSANEGGTATIGVTSGKWYWENRIKAVGNACSVGIFPSNNQVRPIADMHQGNPSIYYKQDGNKQVDDSSSSYGNSFTTGDIIGVALNLDDDEIKFYKNNTVQNSGTAISVTATSEFYNPVQAGTNNSQVTANFGSDSSFAGDETAQGNQDGNSVGDFYYAPPTDFLALCTSNLSDPEIKLPGDHFNTILYDGTSGVRSLTGVGFSPAAVWIKSRPYADSHQLFDVPRGVLERLQPDSTLAESSLAASLTSFDSDGFSLGGAGQVNNSSYTFVAWNWKAGTAFDPATAGTVTTGSGVSNADAGFSVVKYTGESGAMTIGHGLSEAPQMIIGKNMDTASVWPVGTDELTSWVYYLKLDATSSETSDSTVWNSTGPDASVFSIGTNDITNEDGVENIAYCFHSIEGYSKVGSYEGNGNADGTFIYTGFRPSWFLCKNIDSVEGWEVWDNKRDPYNVTSIKLSPDSAAVEYTANETTYAIDFVSNGVKLRTTYSAVNESSTFLFMAFAESPFKYANAR